MKTLLSVVSIIENNISENNIKFVLEPYKSLNILSRLRKYIENSS